MLIDSRLLMQLQRALLTCALSAPLLAAGCGSDPKTGADTDNANADDAGSDDGDTPVVGKKDAGGAPPKPAVKDAGPTITPVAAKDAGNGKPVTPTSTLDGGAGGGSDGGGGSTTPSTSKDDSADPTEASATAMGPYSVKTYTDGYPDAPEYADSTMHYPMGADGPFPAIAIVPGFASTQDTIQMWGPFLASHGFVVLTIGTNSTADQPPARSEALLGAIKTIKGEHTRDGSPIKGKVDLERLGIAGWSMGGGGTLITLNTHPEFKAAFALCPWDPGETFPNIKTPVLFLAAANDELAAGQSQPFYESIPDSTPKMLWERSDADHFNNDPSYEMGAMGRYALSWLKVHMVGDDRYKQFLLVKAPNASDWKTNLK